MLACLMFSAVAVALGLISVARTFILGTGFDGVSLYALAAVVGAWLTGWRAFGGIHDH
jgi:hypothetical protein